MRKLVATSEQNQTDSSPDASQCEKTMGNKRRMIPKNRKKPKMSSQVENRMRIEMVMQELAASDDDTD